jgi:hypothetical protein
MCITLSTTRPLLVRPWLDATRNGRVGRSSATSSGIAIANARQVIHRVASQVFEPADLVVGFRVELVQPRNRSTSP